MENLTKTPKTGKKLLVDLAGMLEDDECQMMYDLIILLGNGVTKSDLLKFVRDGETSGIDTALPAVAVQEIRKINPNFKTCEF